MWGRFYLASLVSVSLSCMTFTPLCLGQALPTVYQSRSPVNYAETKLPDGFTEYMDRQMGVSFRMGHDWRLVDEGVRWRDPGWNNWDKMNEMGVGVPAATVFLQHQGTHESVGLYYRVAPDSAAMTKEDIDKALLAAVDNKIVQRKEKDRLTNYHIRQGSYEPGEIGGWPALSYIAEFTQRRAKMVEYLVWVRSHTTLAEFFIRCPADQLDQVSERVGPIIQSLQIQ